MERLFVYGSLRSDAGHEMHEMGEVLAAAGERESEATVRGRLYAVHWYPGLVLDEQGDDIRGEVWRIEDASVLARLDVYEGCGPEDPAPHEFRRVRARVRMESGAEVQAWVYVYAQDVDEASRVATGDWAERGRG